MKHADLLTRGFFISKLSQGTDYRIKRVLIERSQNVSPGDELCVIEYKTIKKQPDMPDIISLHQYTIMFDSSAYGSVIALEIRMDVGDRLTEDPAELFSYSVEYNFGNLIEAELTNVVSNTSNLYIHVDIPSKKLNNAISSYAPSVSSERVRFLYDDTIFGSGKEGFLVTDSALYVHTGSARNEIRFNEIDSWKHIEEEVVNEDEIEIVKYLEINQTNALLKISHETRLLKWGELDSLLNLIQSLRDEGTTKDVDGMVIIQDMSEEVKLAYINLIIWVVYADDGEIDTDELAELQLLMTQLAFTPELRYQCRLTLHDPSNLLLDSLVQTMFQHVPSGSDEGISFALAKDVIRVSNSTSSEDRHYEQIRQICIALDVKEDQLDTIRDSLDFDKKLLDGTMKPNDMKKSVEAIASKAAAAGVPIAAVYLSGTAGLSAAGITSGLAGLGFGGILGLSSMVTGIGVAVLLGIGVYKGLQWLITGKDSEKYEHWREAMLHEVLKNHQKTIACLGEDLAFFANRLLDLTKDVTKNELMIEKLRNEINLFSLAMKFLSKKSDRYTIELDSVVEKRNAA